MKRSVFRGFKLSTPALLAACLLSATPARAQFFPFWGQPTARPQAAPAPAPLSPGQVRAVLAREGARLIGAPRRRGTEIVAIGRDEDGDRKRFTLDAITGEVLDITVLVRPEERAPPTNDLAPPDAALPPPEHAPGDAAGPQPDLAPEGGREPAQTRAAPVSPSAPAVAAGVAAAPKPATAKPDAASPNAADAALSPIKPLRPAPGAPKVEPLPQ
jgi:hypothetical protein